MYFLKESEKIFLNIYENWKKNLSKIVITSMISEFFYISKK